MQKKLKRLPREQRVQQSLTVEVQNENFIIRYAPVCFQQHLFRFGYVCNANATGAGSCCCVGSGGVNNEPVNALVVVKTYR